MVNLRRKGGKNLKFLADSEFYQTKATYCTWLMSICLKAAIELVKRAMPHK